MAITQQKFMHKLLRYALLLVLSFPLKMFAQFERGQDSIVQLYGVVMTADSLQAIPALSVVVKGTSRGTMTKDQGVFSIVVLKGDKVEFTSISFKAKTIEIPQKPESN